MEDRYIAKYDECLGVQIFDTVELIFDNSSYKGFFLKFESATVTGTKFSDVILLRKKDMGDINIKKYKEWLFQGEGKVVHTRMVLTEKKNFKYKAI